MVAETVIATTPDAVHSRIRLWQRPAFWLLIITALSLLFSIPEMVAPLSLDVGIYAYIGRALAHGQVLYRDVWDFKSPGIYYFFAALFRFLPDSITTLRLVGIGFITLGNLGCWALARRFFSPTTAAIITIFVIIWTQISGVLNGDGPYPETFIMPLIALTYLGWFRYKDSGRWGWLFWCGLMAGGLGLLKQTTLVTLFGLILILAIEGATRVTTRRQTLLALLALVLGFAIVIVPWFFYFVAHNALSDMTLAVFRYPALYAGTTPLAEGISNGFVNLRDLASSLDLLYIAVPIGVWIFWRQHTGKPLAEWVQSPFFALIVWAVLETISICAPLRFYDRYWLQPLLALVLISGLAIDRLITANLSQPNAVRVPALIGIGGLLVIAIAAPFPAILAHVSHRLVGFQENRVEAVTDYLKAHSNPTDAIFAWADNRIPYASGHPTGVKWINTEPFRTSKPYSTSPAVIAEILAELQANPPRYFIEGTVYGALSQSYLGGSAVDAFIKQHYHPVAQILDTELYEYQ